MVSAIVSCFHQQKPLMTDLERKNVTSWRVPRLMRGDGEGRARWELGGGVERSPDLMLQIDRWCFAWCARKCASRGAAQRALIGVQRVKVGGFHAPSSLRTSLPCI